MQWIHKVKIHPKMIYNRPPLNCQKCQFRFFTDQGLERHLLGSHGLVTSSMQEAANKSKDAGRCPVCGRVIIFYSIIWLCHRLAVYEYTYEQIWVTLTPVISIRFYSYIHSILRLHESLVNLKFAVNEIRLN